MNQSNEIRRATEAEAEAEAGTIPLGDVLWEAAIRVADQRHNYSCCAVKEVWAEVSGQEYPTGDHNHKSLHFMIELGCRTSPIYARDLGDQYQHTTRSIWLLLACLIADEEGVEVEL